MVYGYVRVSTDKQTVENQIFEIKSRYSVDEWLRETISSRVQLEKRQLNRLLNGLKQNDIVIVSELSRLGRSVYEIASIIKLFKDKDITLIAIKENFKLDGSITSLVLTTMLSLIAEVERELLSQRITEALKRVKASGKKLGRKTGFKCSKFAHKADEIKEMAISKGITCTANHYKITRKSVYYIIDNY